MSTEEIKKHLVELENRMKSLETKIDKILELVESDCKKMREHIDFVETVYENVKTPFNYVMDRVNYLVYADNTAQHIEDKKEKEEKEEPDKKESK